MDSKCCDVSGQPDVWIFTQVCPPQMQYNILSLCKSWQHMQTRCITVKKKKHSGFSYSRFCCFSLKDMKLLKASESEGERETESRERKRRLWKMFDGSRLPDGGVSRISQVFVTMLINNTEISVVILPNQEGALKSTCADLHACLQTYMHTVTATHRHTASRTPCLEGRSRGLALSMTCKK